MKQFCDAQIQVWRMRCPQAPQGHGGERGAAKSGASRMVLVGTLSLTKSDPQIKVSPIVIQTSEERIEQNCLRFKTFSKHQFIKNKMKPTNPNADTYVEKQRFNTYLSQFPANPLVEHPDLTHWGDTLVGHPCLTLLRYALVRHSCLTLL